MIRLATAQWKVTAAILAALTVGCAGIFIPSSVVATYPGSAPNASHLFELRGGSTQDTAHAAFAVTRRPGILEQFYWRLRSDTFIADYSNDAKTLSDSASVERSASVGQYVGEHAYDPSIVMTGSGVVVADVEPGTAAARAPLKTGDEIVAINDQPVEDEEDLRLGTELARDRNADLVRLTLGTGLRIWMAVEPRGAAGTFSGATIRTVSPIIERGRYEVLPLPAYSGGSSGLVTAMAVFQQAASLDGIAPYVAIGDVDPDGFVADIGPTVRQHVLAALQARVDTILVPAGDEEAAKRAATDDVTIVPIRTFDDARNWMERFGD